MSTRFLSAAVAVALAAVPLYAADPPKPAITAQAQPLGKLLGDVKTMAKIVAGDDAVKAMEDGLKDGLGEKGFAGVDLNRHFLGYMTPSETIEKTSGVILVPITGEDAFKEFVERIFKKGPEIKLTAVEGKKGLFKLDSEKDPAPIPIHVRYAEGYAYVAINIPSADFTAESLVKTNDLLVRNDTALISYRTYMDRYPAAMKKAAFEQMDKLAEQFGDVGPESGKKALKLLVGMVKRITEQTLTEGEVTGYRLVFDANTGEVAFEGWLKGKAGTPLAKDIAARKPGMNQFAGMLTKDAAIGGTLQLPLFAPELRELTLLGLEEGEKALMAGQKDAPELIKDLFSEPFKGLARTVKTGEFDIGAAVVGPDKDGHFNFAFGMSYEDTSNLDKLLRDFLKLLPESQRKHIKLDVAKVGTVNIHEVRQEIIPPRPDGKDLPPGSVYVALAPKAIYVTFGTTGLDAIKALLQAKPAPARAFDFVVNPKRTMKLVETFVKNKDEVEAFTKAFGTEDETLSAFHIEVLGGEELKVRAGMNLKLIPRISVLGRTANSTFKSVEPAKE